MTPLPPSYPKYWSFLGDPVELPTIVGVTFVRQEEGRWCCLAETEGGPRFVLPFSERAMAEIGTVARTLVGKPGS